MSFCLSVLIVSSALESGSRPASGGKEPAMAGPGARDSAESPPPTGIRPTSSGAAGILATLVPTGFRQPHMIESMAQGGPSHASGKVQAGDLLLEVDGVDVRTLSFKDIQTKIIGRTGTQLTLTLQRGKRNFPHKVTLARSESLALPAFFMVTRDVGVV